MRGVLYYFSGTGNTKWVADRFKKTFEFYGSEIELLNIEKLEGNAEFDAELLILGTPVYGGMPPRLFLDFLSRLPLGEGKRCLIYSTQEKVNSPAAGIIAKKVREKGYSVIMQSGIMMPGSFYFRKHKYKLEDKDIEEILAQACKKIKELVQDITMDKQIFENPSLVRIVADKIVNKNFNSRLHIISKKIEATSACSKCGVCLRNCPKGNVTFENGQAVFHSNCMLCLRCIHICPINAITYGGKSIKQTQKDIIKNLDII
jgi:ferredoxin